MTDAKNRGPPKDNWRTPLWLIKKLEKYFNVKFTLDPCASPDNHLGIPNIFTEIDDGLKKTWDGVVWVNPPFSRKWEFVDHAYWSQFKDVDTFVIMEAQTDLIDYHKWAKLCSVYFLRPRIAFLDENLETLGNGFRGHMILRFNRNIPRIMANIDLDEIKTD